MFRKYISIPRCQNFQLLFSCSHQYHFQVLSAVYRFSALKTNTHIDIYIQQLIYKTKDHSSNLHICKVQQMHTLFISLSTLRTSLQYFTYKKVLRYQLVSQLLSQIYTCDIQLYVHCDQVIIFEPLCQLLMDELFRAIIAKPFPLSVLTRPEASPVLYVGSDMKTKQNEIFFMTRTSTKCQKVAERTCQFIRIVLQLYRIHHNWLRICTTETVQFL